ncbi:hypothetical protein EDB87DRAFT_383981 [Lactarius vividus]|nr:hypothetical protein EDB87DRAFT_383981 [Lactarius vividus]
MGKSRKAKSKKSKKVRCEVGRVCLSPFVSSRIHPTETIQATPPRFLYSNSEIVRRKDPVSINDVRDLVLHIIADSPPPSWIRVQNTQSIQKLVVLLIPGLTSTVLSLPPLPTSATENPHLPIPIPLPSDPPPPSPSKPPDLPSSVDSQSEEAAALYGGVPFIARTFSHACPTRAPGDTTRMHSVLNTFFQTPVSGEEKKRRLQERISAERTQKKNPAQYILTTEQMVENDYPVPSYLADVFTKSEGWIETPQAATDAEGSHKVYAVDCEMCMTNDGKALTRVCVIDFDSGKVVYDQLVKPPSPITDYLTRYSGITAAALDPVTTTLADVQTHLCTLINPSTILLGHSLESDLRALQLAHPRCIDTALIFHHPRGRPLKPGLAWLTRKWLGRTIQDRGPGGHNPEEDARACIDLLKAKIKNGPGFGEFRADYEPILARIARSQSRNRGSNGAPTRTAIVDHGNPGAWHGASATAPATTVACANDAEVLDGLVGALDSHEFVFGRLMGLADALGWITPKAENVENRNPTGTAETTTENAETPSTADRNGNTLFAAVTDLNAHLTALHAALPPRTALLLFSGHSDPRSMSTLAARRAECQGGQNQRYGNQSDSGAAAAGTGDGAARWSTADDRALEEAVARARMGLLFVGVKT